MIAYASKALSPVEQCYSQTERNALVVVWASEHFHVYIFGAAVTVVTDHKPLLRIYRKASRTSARLEWWCLHLKSPQARKLACPCVNDEQKIVVDDQKLNSGRPHDYWILESVFLTIFQNFLLLCKRNSPEDNHECLWTTSL